MFGLVLCLFAVAFAVADAGTFHGRILGGQETTIERFPYQVSLQNSKDHFCGGAILTDTVIITASHCFSNGLKKDTKARVGSTYRKKGGQLHDIVKVITPDKTGLSEFDVDVALVIVRPPISFDETAWPVLLGPREGPKTGETLTFTGWGITEPYETTKPFLALSDKLRAASFRVLDNDHCRRAFQNLKTKYTENMFCGGGEGKMAASKGDSGGPVVNTKRELVGIVSWGYPQFPTEEPSVFTNLASSVVRKFIDEYFRRETEKDRGH